PRPLPYTTLFRSELDTPAATVPARRAARARDRGPGSSVTMWRRWDSPRAAADPSLMLGGYAGFGVPGRGTVRISSSRRAGVRDRSEGSLRRWMMDTDH